VLLAAAMSLVLVAPAAAARRSAQPLLLVQMNLVRAQHGLAPLTLDGNLERAARAHSREMLSDGTFAHGAFGSRMAAYGVTGRITGENLGWTTSARGAARGIVLAWLNSPAHRANLLSPSFRRIGVGSIVGSFSGFDGATVVTADFAG
jgi:uncharacterized protein YkwD